MKKILLVNPPFFRFQGLEQNYPPLSLVEVANKLEYLGNEVIVENLEMDNNLKYKGYKDRTESYDLFLDALKNDKHPVWKEFRNTLRVLKPDKIGISVLNVKYPSALKLIEIANEFNIQVMVGGMHPTMFPEKYPDNVSIHQGSFHPEINTPLSYSCLKQKYSPEGYGHIVTAYGCPFQCRFCSSNIMWDRKVIFRDIDDIIKDIEYLNLNHMPSHFTIWDETFFLNKKRVKEFCDKYYVPIYWRCDTRADTITDELIKMVKKAGCDQISIGIESGNNRILDYIKKGETVEDYIRASKILNDNGIQWKAYIIIGFPEENEEDILNTIKFVKSLHPFRITMSIFTPYPGTDLYEECIDKGLINREADLTLFAHQSKYNYFTPKIPKERFFELRDLVSKEIDEYNEKALQIWV